MLLASFRGENFMIIEPVYPRLAAVACKVLPLAAAKARPQGGAWRAVQCTMRYPLECRLVLILVVAFQLAATDSILFFDMRALKVRCCRGASLSRDCEYLALGQTSCREGWTVDNDPAGWECTAEAPCSMLGQAMEMLIAGQGHRDECYAALLDAHEQMRVDVACRPLSSGFTRKCASAARTNLAVATMMRQGDLAGMHRAHRLLSMALICDPESAEAQNNLMLLGGDAVCQDLAPDGEPAANKMCSEMPDYHLRMLNDKPRNAAYAAGIERALQLRPGARVLDIGAGSGLLAIIAAAHGAARVDALEMVLPVAAVASRIVLANANLTRGIVHVWPVKSLDFPAHALPHDPPHSTYKAGVVIHEIFDPVMLGEGVLPALRDLFERQLVAHDTLFVPSAATAYVHAVASAQLASHRWPPRARGGGGWVARLLGGIDYSVVEAYASQIFVSNAPIIETQNMRSSHALTARTAVLRLDFAALPIGGGHAEHEAVVTQPGRLSALLLTFDTEFLGSSTITTTMPNASLPPGEIPSHWGQQVYLIGDGWAVTPGDVIAFTVSWNDWEIEVGGLRVKKRGGPGTGAAQKGGRQKGGGRDVGVQWELPRGTGWLEATGTGCWEFVTTERLDGALDEALDRLALSEQEHVCLGFRVWGLGFRV
jgi:hypothetical protein